ncbi:MAG: 5-formyltetrahydrofolate cyclo-ligase [Pseudomonadota bacterium]
MKEQRNHLRRRIRDQRRNLPPAQRRAAAIGLEHLLGTHPLFLRSRHIAFYLPNDGEIDITPLLERARAMGKQCYLPILSPLYHNRLWFAPYTRSTTLVANRFGIPEPQSLWRDTRHVWALDLVLTPLVAFDADGNRLGMGGGYYDRTLAYLARRRHWRKPRLIGTAYSFQQLESLPHQRWDVPLDGIATESSLLFTTPGRK